MLLVTGGAGYVGSHFLHAYAPHDKDVVVIDNLSAGHTGALSKLGGPVVQCSMGDQKSLDKIFEQYQIDTVVHFAASIFVGESQEQPFKYIENNVVQSINLFHAMERHGVRKIVFSSTCATYGTPQYVPLDEEHPQEPVSVYGYTKLMVEEVLKSLAQSTDWSFVALRYFNAAGAAEDGSLGEKHDPETHLIPLVLRAAKGELPYIQVNGTDYDTPDGTCIRDYIHVSDLAAAHLQAVELLRAEPTRQFINLGTEHGASVKEVIDLCSQVTGKEIKRKYGPRRPGDPPILVANASKAAKVLNWKTERGLKNIIETAWNWEKNPQF